MKVKVKLFARARELAEQEVIEVTLPQNATVRDLRKQLEMQVPNLKPLLPHLFVAVNEDYAADDHSIPPEAKVACFPPVSGG